MVKPEDTGRQARCFSSSYSVCFLFVCLFVLSIDIAKQLFAFFKYSVVVPITGRGACIHMVAGAVNCTFSGLSHTICIEIVNTVPQCQFA